MREPDYGILPRHMREGMQLWIERGIDGGSFMMSILCNDFMGAVSRADSTNIDRLKDFAMFLYNEAPPACFGSREKVKAWAESGGLRGHEEAA